MMTTGTPDMTDEQTFRGYIVVDRSDRWAPDSTGEIGPRVYGPYINLSEALVLAGGIAVDTGRYDVVVTELHEHDGSR